MHLRWWLPVLLLVFGILLPAAGLRACPETVGTGFQPPAAPPLPHGDVTPFSPQNREITLSATGRHPAAWERFRRRHPRWAVIWNRNTGLPRRLLGPPLPLSGACDSTAALAFLQRWSALWGDTWRLASRNCALGRTYLLFEQTVGGLPVMGSRWVLVLDGKQRLLSAHGQLLPPPAKKREVFFQRQKITLEELRKFYPEAVSLQVSIPAGYGEVALPVYNKAREKISYLHCRVAEIRGTESPFFHRLFLDPSEARVRYAQVLGAALSGTVHAQVQMLTPWGPYFDRPLERVRLQAGGETVYTDADGNFALDLDAPAELTVGLQGSRARIRDESGPDPQLQFEVQPDQQLDIFWNNDNSQPAERNSYYHANRAYDWVKRVDPAFSGMDHQVTFHVRDTTMQCNGYWAGDHIYLAAAAGNCADYGEIADVVIHEWGHGLSYAQYGWNYPNGTATAEALSDILAGFVTDQPLMGAGAYGPGTWGRNLHNDLVYPDDLTGEIHLDGQILSGAFWDLREYLPEDYVDSLWQYCKYGYPVEFDDFFWEVLRVDDDDDDMANGTPNGQVIAECFSRHGIGSGLTPVLEHTPLSDTQNTVNPYQVMVRVQPSPVGLVLDSLLLHWRGTDDWQTLPFTLATPPNIYSAAIPPQEYRSLVRYYITALDSLGGRQTLPESGAEHPYFFLVGYPLLVLQDPLEEPGNWQAGAPGDDAESGLWTCADPVGTWTGGMIIQPEDDHTLSGTNCWVTGNGEPGEPAGANDVDGGRTTLLSPPLNLAALSTPIISFWRWWVDETAPDDSWRVDISADGENDWVNVETVTVTANTWTRVRLLPEEYIPLTTSARLRFLAEDTGAGSLVEAALDDFWVMALDTLESVATHTPENFRLSAHPNPFNPETTLEFHLAAATTVSLTVYDLLGRPVPGLRHPESSSPGPTGGMVRGRFSAGTHRLVFNGENLPSGIYFGVLSTGNTQTVIKMMLLR